MSGFEKLLDKVNKYNVNKILLDVWKNPKVKEYIVKLNTEGLPTSQLFEDGVDSLGVKLIGKSGLNYLVGGHYSAYTVKNKIEKGHRYDHPTLKNKGDFYKSHEVKGNLKGFELTADPNVTGDDGSTGNLYESLSSGEKITGLTDENLQILTEYIGVFYLASAKKILP